MICKRKSRIEKLLSATKEYNIAPMHKHQILLGMLPEDISKRAGAEIAKGNQTGREYVRNW